MFEQRHSTRTTGKPVKTLVSALMMALFCLLLAASLSAKVHHFFHKDSHSPTHQCVATQLASGQLLESTLPVSAPAPLAGLEVRSPAFGFFRLTTTDVRLMPERAPPASLL